MVETEEAVTSVMKHVAYSQSTVELSRRTKFLNKLKFRRQVTPEQKRLLRSSPLCTGNVIDPDLSSQVLFAMRSASQSRYPGHKQNTSTATAGSALTKLVDHLSTVVASDPPVSDEPPSQQVELSVAEVVVGEESVHMESQDTDI